MRVLVTGAAGFVGSHLSERLSELGHQAICPDCFTNYDSVRLKELNAAPLEKKGVELLRLDLAEDPIDAALRGIDFVHHTAVQPGISSTTPFETDERNNTVATYRLLEAVKGLESLRGLLNTSTSSVHGFDATGEETGVPEPTPYYGVTKLATEQLCPAYTREQGLPAYSLCLFSVHGPRERPGRLYAKLIRSGERAEPFPLCEGSEHHQRSYTYVSDAVDGTVAVLDRFDACDGEIFNIGTETTHTTGEAIQVVQEMIGGPAIIQAAPPRPGDQVKTQANINKLRRVLGYNPGTSLRDDVGETVRWTRKGVEGRLGLL